MHPEIRRDHPGSCCGSRWWRRRR
ncbi:hypothetical protein [Duganella vulcania]|nr:hypothetical protein [Duganella vulcania]